MLLVISESNVDVTKRLRLFRRGIAESRPAIKLPTRSSSPPEFGSEQDKRLLRENHRWEEGWRGRDLGRREGTGWRKGFSRAGSIYVIVIDYSKIV